MILKMYSVYDMKVGTFSPPMFMHADGQAVRSLIDAAADPNSLIGRHPGDFQLYRLGEWEDSTARFMPHTAPEHICSAESVLVRPETTSA